MVHSRASGASRASDRRMSAAAGEARASAAQMKQRVAGKQHIPRTVADAARSMSRRVQHGEGDPCRLHQVSFLQQVICGRRSNGLTDHAAQVQLRIGKHGCVQRVNI